MRKPNQRELDAMRINPNPRLVWLLNYAIGEIEPRLWRKDEYSDWLSWAVSWKNGEHSPAKCVNVANRCFEHKDNPIFHCLGQLAWGAKEACYDVPQTGWLVVRYIADAMVAFGVAYPKDAGIFLDPPTIDISARAQLTEATASAIQEG